MTNAFVDTTVLTDATLKIGDVAKIAKIAIKRYGKTQLPVYAIKEFKAGPLKNFVWLHNLLTQYPLDYVLEKLRKSSLSPPASE